ncbi:condensation domain-containing protein, partial [Aquimarina addita]|uniref:TubC N-terminal docking domain-related protein n=1 Tax=Aquimarina addita TaxID=870485 RepID=UPI0031E6E2B7
MNNNIGDILRKVNSENIKLELENGCLKLKSKTGIIDAELLNRIKSNKQFIIQYLKKYQNRNNLLEESIIPYNRDNIDKVPLSFSQERLWFLDQLQGSLEYHIPVVLRLEGDLDIDALQDALKMILSR